MINKIFFSFRFLLLISVCGNAAATNLLQVYEQAVYSDAVLQEALAQHRSNSENVPQAMSTLLPSLLGTGSAEQVHMSRANPPNVFPPPGSFDGSSMYYAVELRQPVFNYAGWSQLKFAKAGVRRSLAIYSAAVQNLIARVAAAYFDVLLAKDNLTFTEAELRANQRHWEQARHRYDVGLIAVTDVYEAKASYDALVARQIAAKNEVINKEEALRQITGQVYTNLAPLRKNVPLVTPQPSIAEEWVNAALRQNYNLIAARFAVEAAKDNIAVQKAANLPRLDAVGAYQDQRNSSADIYGVKRYQNTAASLELNLPLIQGGLVMSRTRQAHYDHQAALAQFETAYRQTIVSTRQTFNNVIASISKVKADQQAVLSAKKSLESMEAQYSAGTRTMENLLDAQKDFYERQASLARDQYLYLNATLQLKQNAGTLCANDLVLINNWLQATGARTKMNVQANKFVDK